MPWTPARVVGTLVVAGVIAGASIVLSDARVEVPPAELSADTTTTTAAEGDPQEEEPPSSTTAPGQATATTPTTEAPLPGPVRLVATSRFDLRGVGPIEAGMTVHEAEQAAGLRFTLTPMASTNGRCSSAAPAGLDGLTFIVVAPGGAASTDAKAGTIARAAATVAPFATVSNARVGSPLADARALYAGRYEEIRFGRGGVALTVKGRSGGDADKGVRIESTDGRDVTSLASGLLTALAAPDGCA